MSTDQSSDFCEPLQDAGETNVCGRCHRRRLCTHLAESMALLRTQPSVLVEIRYVRARQALQKRLDFFEFSFPKSDKFCQFSRIDPHVARQLLFRARDLCLNWIQEGGEAG